MASTTLSQIVSDLTASGELLTRIASTEPLVTAIGKAAADIAATLQGGGTLYACGNGGSTCDAMHLCEELVARYSKERRGLRAHHLMDPSIMTCWSNDYSYEGVFQRQVETFCSPTDILVLFSTSGNSKNCIEAARAAYRTGTPTIGLLGKSGGELATLVTTPIIVPSTTTARIQEAHIAIVHSWCEYLDGVFSS